MKIRLVRKSYNVQEGENNILIDVYPSGEYDVFRKRLKDLKWEKKAIKEVLKKFKEDEENK